MNYNISNIIDSIAADGYWVSSEEVSQDNFLLLANELGQVTSTAEICIKKQINIEGPIHTNKSMPFHMDGFQEDYLMWIAFESTDEPTSLVDMNEILKQVCKEDLENLKRINIVRGSLQTKLINEESINYLPFLIDLEELSAELRNSYFNLQDIIKDHYFGNKIDISLKKNHVLIIDNKRLLHGRKKLAEDSNRDLLRLWIQKR